MVDTEKKPVLVLIRGLPGSGKSYIARELQRKLGQDKALVLDPDATRYDSDEYKDFSSAADRDGVDAKLHPYRFLRSQAHEAIREGKYIVWNQAFTNLEIFHKMINGLTQYAKDQGSELICLVVEVDIDVETARRRVQERESLGKHGVSDDAFARFVNDYKSFEAEDFNLVRVDGTDEVSLSVSKIAEKINDL